MRKAEIPSVRSSGPGTERADVAIGVPRPAGSSRPGVIEAGLATDVGEVAAVQVPGPGPARQPLGLMTLAVLAVALIAMVPTVGDLGLTWDEPAYRYSQVMSAQWWEQWARVRSADDVRKLLDPTVSCITGLTGATASISIRPWPAS